MTDTLPLDQSPQPRRLRAHHVRTLPALQSALQDLVREANDRRAGGPIDLIDFDPLHGVTVSLNDDGKGQLFVRFEKRAPTTKTREVS